MAMESVSKENLVIIISLV